MGRYLIIVVYDHGYSNHLEIYGNSLYEAIFENVKLDQEYFGWSPEGLVEENYGVEVDTVEYDDTSGQWLLSEGYLRFYANYIMEAMFDSHVDGDSNPGYIIFDINDDKSELSSREDVFSTHGVTVGELPKLIYQEDDVVRKEVLKLIFLNRLEYLKHKVKYECRCGHISMDTLIEVLADENIQVHSDFISAEFDDECVDQYLPEFRVGSFVKDLKELCYN